ncbi:lytic murein transglycosylase [Nitratireductor sp. ZSWI3]|uniref:lytic murein transglycosylase n=1 Tax=Nitratireductor sp. ZSWI3 TaxID=2966359 RepID=UPI00215016F4|nr:lytic murein transglycosylase [Nitratireductor sp. ZSWI3]MCR4268677.1 lytic murein transglycosylase [Nitratireductor sp. ZSWI3]
MALILSLIAAPAAAQSIDRQFQSWLADDLWPEARARGISSETFNAAFAGVKPNLKLPDLVLPGETKPRGTAQHQAEFRAPEAYFKHIGGVVSGGRARAAGLAAGLAAIERAYGVPRGILLAIWGRESGFGSAKIPYDAFEVLGTKAFLATRKEMFRQEVLAALEMVERRGVGPRAMRSSWAGAMGQPQFMPSSYLKYAVDGDGDGRADIWNSDLDTLASIANYLAKYGWVKGRDWGFEVTVPATVSCALEGPDRGKRIADWQALGVRRVGGKDFPAHELRAEGYLMMPAGRYGPAFLVTPNFYRLKDYNESDLYALFVGHAGDRIMYGDLRFAGAWQRVAGFDRGDVAALQRSLERLGYDVGGADGLAGFKTRRSIGAWQQKNGQAATCFPEIDIMRRLK